MAMGRVVVSTGMTVVTVGTGRSGRRVRMPRVSTLVVAMAEAELYCRAGQAQERREKAQH